MCAFQFVSDSTNDHAESYVYICFAAMPKDSSISVYVTASILFTTLEMHE